MPRATKRPCLGRCGALVDVGTPRCPECTRAAEKARGSRRERHYDAAYDAARRMLYARAMRASDVGRPELCPVCRKPLLRGQRLELGHRTPLNVNPRSRDYSMVHAGCNPRGTSPENMGTS